MKLAIPIKEDPNIGKKIVARSFTETDMLCIYDHTSKEENTLLKSELFSFYQQDNLILILKELGINSVVSTRFMPMAMRFFERNNIAMYKATTQELEELIDSFVNNKLPYFTQADAVEEGCTGSCSTCSSESCK